MVLLLINSKINQQRFKEMISDYMRDNCSAIVKIEEITDIKVMNTIYWSIANPLEKRT